jgi:nucleotide-binding universal stress UspA family protein
MGARKMKILMAIDDSKFSEQSLRVICAQISSKGTEVRVLHVLQPITVAAPPQMSARYTPELEAQAKEAQELIKRAADSLSEAGFKVSTAVEKGDVRLKIIDAAKDWGADLVVVGSHGRSGIPRLLLGSVAEFVARHAPCSVEIVRTSAKK